ncbi:MAG TPA: glutamate-1-semialdehyde 2,1-aminomutase [Planctomycetota bacterium]|nr:glutamate-1-semialdehyde 2,1-aminomutase [Planctomycetota bacterium]
MKTRGSRAAFRRALRSIPGGVNSPVRAFRAVGGDPLFIRRASGAWLEDLDGNRYLDFVGSWGPLILGHAHPEIVAAVTAAARRGTTFGAPTEGETELAELIKSALPSIKLLRLVSSGTEACMSALRLARAFTKRPGVIKFEGCYHGHADPFLVKAGSGAATFGTPTSPGVEADHTIVVPYNDPAAFTRVMKKSWRKIAAVIVEPVAGNMGVVPPLMGFLETLREVTVRHGTLLVFDEVITGFRVAWGGAQSALGIAPDLTTLGKIIGGGLPLAAYGGRRDVMNLLAPAGPVYQAGTLSGNPLAVAAGLAQLRRLKADSGFYGRLDRLGARFEQSLKESGVTVNRVGSMMTAFFASGPVTDWKSASRCDTAAYGRFFRRMLASGVYLPPSQFEAMFVGAAHSGRDIDRAGRAARVAL